MRVQYNPELISGSRIGSALIRPARWEGGKHGWETCYPTRLRLGLTNLAAFLLSSDLGLILEMGWDAQMKLVLERLGKIVLFDHACTGWSQRKGIYLARIFIKMEFYRCFVRTFR
jgi:hypothetical protein